MITLRGLGFVYASMGHLDRAEAAYSKARVEATKKKEDSASSLGCWRELAVLAREQGEHAKAEARVRVRVRVRVWVWVRVRVRVD